MKRHYPNLYCRQQFSRQCSKTQTGNYLYSHTQNSLSSRALHIESYTEPDSQFLLCLLEGSRNDLVCVEIGNFFDPEVLYVLYIGVVAEPITPEDIGQLV
jgi:hypothetical protein